MASEYCNEHEWERVDTIEWNTGNPRFDEQNQTAKYECVDCPAFRVEVEDRTGSLENYE